MNSQGRRPGRQPLSFPFGRTKPTSHGGLQQLVNVLLRQNAKSNPGSGLRPERERRRSRVESAVPGYTRSRKEERGKRKEKRVKIDVSFTCMQGGAAGEMVSSDDAGTE